MRRILTWILAFGLAASPALAGTEGSSSKDSTAANWRGKLFAGS